VAAPGTDTGAGTVREALSAATDALRAAGADTPRLDAELLLAEATGRPRESLAADPDRSVSGPQARVFGGFVRRRVAREPVAYILGRRGFRNLELLVDRRALIPRPETELLVDVALELEPGSVLDVGTGGGAVALAIADELPSASIVAVDVSADALAVARENSMALGLGKRVELRHGRAAAAAGSGPFDLVVANLPYVPDGDRAGLGPEITEFEPEVALYAGPDGLDAIRELLAALAPGGIGPVAKAVALEIGAGQAAAVAELVRGAGFEAVETRRDLAGIERVVIGRR
jgi:release factor glutamine methyltransferase